MFDPALEYRKFVQRKRTIDEKQAKLTELALRVRAKEPERSLREVLNAIVTSYQKGEDILSYELFEREDIEAFAKKNKIQNDPQVRTFIELAQPRAAWGY